MKVKGHVRGTIDPNLGSAGNQRQDGRSAMPVNLIAVGPGAQVARAGVCIAPLIANARGFVGLRQTGNGADPSRNCREPMVDFTMRCVLAIR